MSYHRTWPEQGVPQVFVSYARADRRLVARLVTALRRARFEPWWDYDIAAGESWEQTIERALDQADAVIVCWSAASVASENVRSEARVARTRGRLLQIFLEPCDPPLFFGERQGIDLTDWNGSVRHPQFDRLEQALRAIIESPPSAQPAQAHGSMRRPHFRLDAKPLIMASAVVAILAFGGWWWQSSSSAPSQSRVAVQPIAALGGGSAIASFADGLTDQITTSLNDGHIPTVSRSDAQSLKGSDKQLKSLGVGYTLNGTAEASGKTLHARLHLDDSVRHASLWSFEASGSADDPAVLNYAIASSIGGVISCAYRALGPGGLTDAELLSRYLRVCDLFVNHQDASDSKSTFELLKDLRLITAKAPSFAPAHSDLAKFGSYLAPLMTPADAARVRAEAAREADLALALDPHSGDAWLARSWLVPPTDWARREALLRKAVSVNPDWPHTNGFLAMFLTETGRMRESIPYAERAAAADLQLEWRPFSAKMACDARDTAPTISDLRERLSVSPGDPTIQWALRSCLLDSGQFREAMTLETPVAPGSVGLGAFRRAVEVALISERPSDRAKAEQLGAKLSTGDKSMLPFIVQWTAALGDVDRAFQLAQQFSPGYPQTGITSFLFSPQAESMRRDPRFFHLAKQYGLAQFWQSTGRWPDFCSGPRLSSCKAAVAAQLAQR
jgi:TolB-like protein